MYSSGSIKKSELVAKLKQLQRARQIKKNPTPTTPSDQEPQGNWQRWIVYGLNDDGRNVPLTAVSARDRPEATRLAFRWGRDNNRVVLGLELEDEDVSNLANMIHRNESKEIVTELANQPYPYKIDIGSREETNAIFKTANGQEYVVSIGTSTGEDEDDAGVEFFANQGLYGASHVTNAGDAFKVFATVAKILKTYLNKYKTVRSFTFNSDMSEPSRVKLYNTMARMMPKFITNFKYVGSDEDIDIKTYRFEKVKKPTTFKEYVEESAKPFIWNKEEPKKELTEMQKACILGGQEYTGEIN